MRTKEVGKSSSDLEKLKKKLTRDIARMEGIPPHGRRAILKFFLALASRGEDLTEEQAKQVEALSVYGADPDWQIAELEKITEGLDRRD